HHGEQGIHAVQRFGFHGNAQHGKRGLGGGHTGEVRGAAGGGDDDFQAAPNGGGGVFKKEVRGAVRGDHLHVMRHAQFRELLGRVLHGFPVRLAAHDDADQRFVCCICHGGRI